MRKIDKLLWFAMMDRLTHSVLQETAEDLSSDLPSGQSMAEAAENFRNQLLKAFDASDTSHLQYDVQTKNLEETVDRLSKECDTLVQQLALIQGERRELEATCSKLKNHIHKLERERQEIAKYTSALEADVTGAIEKFVDQFLRCDANRLFLSDSHQDAR